MQGKRIDRVGHLIQMELGELILRRIKDPRVGFVTITHVKVTPDLRSACVYYTSMGTEEERQKTHSALEKSAGFLQKQIGASLQLRYTPKLKFIFDESLEKGLEIDRVLRDLHKEN